MTDIWYNKPNDKRPYALLSAEGVPCNLKFTEFTWFWGNDAKEFVYLVGYLEKIKGAAVKQSGENSWKYSPEICAFKITMKPYEMKFKDKTTKKEPVEPFHSIAANITGCFNGKFSMEPLEEGKLYSGTIDFMSNEMLVESLKTGINALDEEMSEKGAQGIYATMVRLKSFEGDPEYLTSEFLDKVKKSITSSGSSGGWKGKSFTETLEEKQKALQLFLEWDEEIKTAHQAVLAIREAADKADIDVTGMLKVLDLLF